MRRPPFMVHDPPTELSLSPLNAVKPANHGLITTLIKASFNPPSFRKWQTQPCIRSFRTRFWNTEVTIRDGQRKILLSFAMEAILGDTRTVTGTRRSSQT